MQGQKRWSEAALRHGRDFECEPDHREPLKVFSPQEDPGQVSTLETCSQDACKDLAVAWLGERHGEPAPGWLGGAES